VNRVLVHKAVAADFEARPAGAVRALAVGPGVLPGLVQAPLIDEPAVEKVKAHVADALGKGGRLVAGGHRHALGRLFFEPTVIGDCKPAMALASELRRRAAHDAVN
jgi:succinate-semialdehyde dehydrogenase/glutarate-semialdehyde dehydrogenase